MEMKKNMDAPQRGIFEEDNSGISHGFTDQSGKMHHFGES